MHLVLTQDCWGLGAARHVCTGSNDALQPAGHYFFQWLRLLSRQGRSRAVNTVRPQDGRCAARGWSPRSLTGFVVAFGVQLPPDASVFLNVHHALLRLAEPVLDRLRLGDATEQGAVLEDIFPPVLFGCAPDEVDISDLVGTPASLPYFGANRLGGVITHLRKEAGLPPGGCVGEKGKNKGTRGKPA